MRTQFKDVIQCYSKVIEYFASYYLEVAFLTVFNRVEEHLYLHFVKILTHLSLYGKTLLDFFIQVLQ